jgi:hypothetical protein
VSELQTFSAGPDPEWDQYLAWMDREAAAGRDPDEAQRAFTDDADASTSAAQTASADARYFAQDHESALPPPGPLLAGLTEQAVADLCRLTDDELVGVLQASQRQVAREHYKQVLATAEFGRRRQAEFADAARRGMPVAAVRAGSPARSSPSSCW